MNKKVLLGLSGGVDSSVAALLLKKQGYEVTGAFMKCFSNSNLLQGDCNSTIDKKEAQKIAAILDIPLVILDYQKEYKKLVIDPMFEDYKKGLTPNPDSLCNKIIKFPLLWKEAKKRNIDFIATGHYIKKIKTSKGYKLKIAKDKTKDQSYFLYDLTQDDLKHTLFPIADLTKEEVRKIAQKNKFPNAEKHGTRGLCFIGKIDMKSFLKQKIKPKPGKVLDEKGNAIGKHEGIMYYTIGERVGPRSGIEITPEFHNKMKSKLYIADKNIKNNTITISPKKSKKNKFKIINTNWINPKEKLPKRVKVRIRHLGELMPAKLNNSKITLDKPAEGIAEGQSCVIYKNNSILGGGEIRY